ncbi:cation-translocating P-type ATPase [Spiroplasma platyhelix]|uniref:Cation-translocating P-type ATPase n=1 Tax=Spiroplasma platyhelix PALS-1 TaxID=1276218 RepID=A0A846U0Y2_9MOLU|nr:cation-translocating P-type ATPase [Spiroplasma platyhelix]MBE4704106.1 Calcium-transporting ATPase 1 [Spiroplasma platyhelix PALS-1]NKE38476.1 cation-translocating P-type ATPase [Spiroplasma platyhelix PALS-1]UJB29364.1 Ca2+-transporting ATPase [Spiroplasma platyhelix PALS-1]
MFWNEDINKIKENLNTDLEKGLTDKQAFNLLKQNGPNALPTSKKKSIFTMCVEHLIEPFTFVLIALLIIAAVLNKWAEVIVISLIVVLEMVLSIYQERKAMNSLDSLKKLVKENAVVIREGKKFTIDVKNLVVGDLVYLEAGMFLPADVRIIQSFNLRVNESLLTGESNLIMKTIDPIAKENLSIGDRTNMAFMSTMIAAGSGLGIVVATGKNTEIGKITKLLQDEEEPKSPLSRQITFIVRTICLFALALGIFIFCIQYLVSGNSWVDALVFTIALVVAVIPEGLSVIVTVSLSLGSRRMAKHNAIVKRLNAVETLGQVNVICSDKTGTLTENRMTVTKYFVKDEVEEEKTLKLSTLQRKLFLQCLVLDNNSSVADKKITGDPTEIALLKWAEDLKLNSNSIQKSYPRVHELPFDSERKLMSTVNKYDAKQYLFVKGAADNLLKRCTHYLIDDKKFKMTEEFKTNLIAKLQEMSDQALRVLGAAYKEIATKKPNFNNIEQMEKNLIFLGLVGMIDPPRREIKEVLVHTREAGIDTKMITGDHLNTAVAIGKELTILDNKEQALSGEQIDKLSDRVLKRDIHKYQVFARVSPQHKVRIIKALQANGNIVSMTGDGVNDAPSLKAANIGVAMGVTGTDVAKEASQVVLTDDNFLTIVDAIEEGRNIYNKLKRIICFIIITNLAQVLAITIGIFLNWGDLLSALQVLWINLIVESFLAITMSMGPNNPRLMKEKPIAKKENILRGSWKFIIYVSLITATLLIVTYKFLPLGLETSVDVEGYIYAFVFMSNAPVFYSMSFAVGRNDFMLNKMLLQNRPFLISVLIAFIINVGIVFIPGVNTAFGVEGSINFVEWICCFAIAIVPTILLELFKGFLVLIKPKVDKKMEEEFPEFAAKQKAKAEKKRKTEDKILAKKEKHDEEVDKKIEKTKAKIDKKKKKKNKK